MFKNLIHTALAIALLLSFQGCLAGIQLETKEAEPAMVQGDFDLYLYGCRYPSQPDNVVFLISKKAAYNFEIFDIDSSFKVQKDIGARDALQTADSFVKCSMHSVWMTQLRRIVDPAGNTFGYELRPYYVPLEFGIPDIMRISYSLRNNKVSAYIKLDRDVERRLYSPDDRHSSSRDGAR